MDKIKDYFKRIYGMDCLFFGCVLLSVLMNMAALLVIKSGHDVGRPWNLISCIPLLACLYRCFSTNRERRAIENDWFIRRLDSIFVKKADNDYGEKYRTGYTAADQEEDKEHFKFFKCPSCRQKIRVPRGKGRIEITCPRCGNKFIKKT